MANLESEFLELTLETPVTTEQVANIDGMKSVLEKVINFKPIEEEEK